LSIYGEKIILKPNHHNQVQIEASRMYAPCKKAFPLKTQIKKQGFNCVVFFFYLPLLLKFFEQVLGVSLFFVYFSMTIIFFKSIFILLV